MHPALLRFLAWPRREEGAYPQRSVTDEQRRPGQKAKQPFGRERFGPSGGVARSLQTHAGMRVTRALPATTNCSCAAPPIYEMASNVFAGTATATDWKDGPWLTCLSTGAPRKKRQTRLTPLPRGIDYCLADS